MTHPQGPNPNHILQAGMGFFATKTLLSAVELGLFTRLSGGPKTGRELERELELRLPNVGHPLAGPTSAAIAYK